MKFNVLTDKWRNALTAVFCVAVSIILFITVYQFFFSSWPISTWIFVILLVIEAFLIAVSLNMTAFRKFKTDSNGFVLNYGIRIHSRFKWNDVKDIYYIESPDGKNQDKSEFRYNDMSYERARFNVFTPVCSNHHRTVCIVFNENSGIQSIYISFENPDAFIEEAEKLSGKFFIKP